MLIEFVEIHGGIPHRTKDMKSRYLGLEWLRIHKHQAEVDKRKKGGLRPEAKLQEMLSRL